ncbi:hypothetical protein TruAng_005153 [Truncatella angustata]|nr:hypothetical protein TruAng_005153 [Truncatella angustata]
MSHPFVEALRPQKRNVSWTDWLRTQLSRLGIGGSTTPPLLHLFDYLPKQKHILITGLDAAGKSTLLRKYLSPNGDEGVVTHRPALGCLVEETCHGNVYFYTLDLGGGRPRAVMNMEREIIADMDAVVWVLDSTDRDRLVEAKEEMARMICGAAGLGRDKPVLLLANKQQVFTEKGDCVPAIEYSEAGNLFVHVLGDRRWLRYKVCRRY